jgi:hypothetical protein
MEQDRARITSEEIKRLKETAKYILYDQKRNRDITEERKTLPVLKKSTTIK